MPRRGDLAPYHHGDLRNALCKHALRVVETEGVGALRLRQAARAVGVSPSAVYRHFEDKAALLRAVVEDGYERVARAMEAAAKSAEGRAPPGQEARSALMAMGASIVRFAAMHPTHFQAMIAAPAPPLRKARKLLGRAVERCLEQSRPSDMRAARRAAFAAIYGLAVLVSTSDAEGRELEKTDALAQEALAIVLRGAQRAPRPLSGRSKRDST